MFTSQSYTKTVIRLRLSKYSRLFTYANIYFTFSSGIINCSIVHQMHVLWLCFWLEDLQSGTFFEAAYPSKVFLTSLALTSLF